MARQRAATGPIHRGDQVFQDEWVRTAAESLAQLALRDETNVSLGPSSQVKLDRFVFDGSGSTAKKVLLDATKGTFRFFSGNSPHDAYQVTTPQATIGVRGTVYDVEIEPGRTRVVLQEGAVHVCVRNTRLCTDLTEIGTQRRRRREGHFGAVAAGPEDLGLRRSVRAALAPAVRSNDDRRARSFGGQDADATRRIAAARGAEAPRADQDGETAGPAPACGGSTAHTAAMSPPS